MLVMLSLYLHYNVVIDMINQNFYDENFVNYQKVLTMNRVIDC